MGRREWTDAEQAQLEAALAGGADADALMQAFPYRSWKSLRGRMTRTGLKFAPQSQSTPSAAGMVEQAHARPDFGEPPKQPVDLVQWLDTAVERTTSPASTGADKDYRRIVIKTDGPIAIMKSADWHFGGLDVDYAALKQHIRFLFDTPGMYLQLFGDDLNMMAMHRVVSARRDAFDAEEQIEFLRSFIHKTVSEGKLVSMGWGNHSDEFTERNAGFGIVKVIVDNAVPYFRGIGKVDLVLQRSDGGEEVYRIGFAHKVRFHSFMNPLHGNKRMQQMHSELFGRAWPIADVYVTAHTHNPALSCEGGLPDDRTWFVKTGTFKTDCLYSQRYFGQGRIGVPTLVYHADRHEVVGLPTPWEAYRYMTGNDWVEGASDGD